MVKRVRGVTESGGLAESIDGLCFVERAPMSKKAGLIGVQAKGPDRIQFDFRIAGVRYRPTIYRKPTEANLRRAHEQLRDIKSRIKSGTFNFDEEFPDYRCKDALPSGAGSDKNGETCGEVFNKFLAHCEMRVSMDDMAFSTLDGYREILDVVFRPKIGEKPFEQVVYSQLAEIVSAHARGKKKKTYNNVTSAVRTAFKFGYKDRPGKFNPALALETFRITEKDRPKVEPFTIQEAETIIVACHHIHGEWYGNYEEFGFFTGLRQSEQFALEVGDCDLANGKISVTKAVVLSQKKNRTKTSQDREINLCPRALAVLRRQLALRERMVAAGKVRHKFVFFTEGGAPFQTVYLPYNRWREVLETLPVRYRKPYNRRHSYSSWRLMIGHNRLLVAMEDGHSVATMERTYAAWTKGAKPEDVELIKAAMGGSPKADVGSSAATESPLQSPEMATKWPPAKEIAGVQAVTSTTGEVAPDRVSSSIYEGKCRNKTWLGWQDSNLRMAGSKPAALPLGDTPAKKFTDSESGARAPGRYSNPARRRPSTDPPLSPRHALHRSRARMRRIHTHPFP